MIIFNVLENFKILFYFYLHKLFILFTPIHILTRTVCIIGYKQGAIAPKQIWGPFIFISKL